MIYENYLRVYDANKDPVCILKNAYAIKEERSMNALWYLSFSLPENDSNIKYCNPFWYVRVGKKGELYKILPYEYSESDVVVSSYKCEHVLSNLMKKVMPFYVQFGGYYEQTRSVLERLLSFQDSQEWVLGDCDFSRRFEYSFERENLLGAVFSIPRCFNEDYIWTWDTSVFPWKLNLKIFDKQKDSKLYVRYGSNQLKLIKSPDYSTIVTKLYAFGAGEGVNSLDIKEQTNGRGFVLADQECIDKYGIIESCWTDRRYESSESLYSAALAMIKELQEPIVSYSAGFIGDLDIGDFVDIAGHIKTFVVKKNIGYDEFNDISYELANKQYSIAQTIADLADRQRIETTYSQGATNIYAIHIAENGDVQNPVECSFYLPDNLKSVNKIMAKIKAESFRAYSGATTYEDSQVLSSQAGGGSYSSTDAGGGQNSTTSDGGGREVTSRAGGSSNSTSDAGGSTYYSQTSGSSSRNTTPNKTNYVNGTTGTSGTSQMQTGKTNSHWHYFTAAPNHSHNYQFSFTHTHDIGHTHMFNVSISAHSHMFRVGSHSHTVDIPSHYHSFIVYSHSHTVHIDSHSHTVVIPGHGHDIVPGINRFGNPSVLRVVGNDLVSRTFNSVDIELDVTDMFLNERNEISRGAFQSLKVFPNDLAYIKINITVIGFIQSHEGGNF